MAMNLIIAARIQYLDPETETAGELRVSSHPYRDPAVGVFQPRIAAGTDPELHIEVSLPQWRSRAQTSYGTLELVNVDGFYDHIKDLVFQDQLVEVRFLTADALWDAPLYAWRALVDQVNFRGERRVEIVQRSLAQRLRVPVQREVFPDVPAEELREQPIPLILGAPLQVPALLYDEVGAAEVRWYVAGNQEGLARVQEGGLDINPGSNPGEYQPAEGGFTLNKKATLPVTADPIGPLAEPLPLASTRFFAWENFGGVLRPQGWTWTNWVTGTREMRQWPAGAESARVITGVLITQLFHAIAGLAASTAYRLRIHTAVVAGWENRATLSVATGTGSTWTTHATDVVDASTSDIHEFEFTCGAGQTQLRLGWQRLSASLAGELLVTGIQLGTVGVPKRRIGELAPHLACAMADPPLAWGDIDYDSLAELDAAAGNLHHAMHLRGDETVEVVLDQLVQSCFGAWWYDDRLRFGRLVPPEDADPVLTITDQQRTAEIGVRFDSADHLTRTISFDRNQQPIPMDRAAQSLDQGLQARNARDFRLFSTRGGPLVAGLHPRYRNAVGAEPYESTIRSGGTAGAPGGWHAAALGLYQRGRFWWTPEFVIGRDQLDALQHLRPLAAVKLVSPRWGLVSGRLCRIVGIRVRPLSGRVQLLLMG